MFPVRIEAEDQKIESTALFQDTGRLVVLTALLSDSISKGKPSSLTVEDYG